MTKVRKKLIEVALPLEAINKAAAREKSIRHGHPSTLHLWWARRPLAAARAVIFSQMVDDPSAIPELFATEKAQEKERKRLFKIIEDLVQWENTNNEEALERARAEIWQSWRRACADNADHPRAKELFNRHKLPAFHDPFAGGGALPLEAQRLGLEAYASDLNPVAVLINKAMIEIPPKFADRPPVNPESRANKDLVGRQWKGAEGLAEDVRYYGKWMRDEAEKRIGHLYPKVEITAEMAKERPDLKPLIGQRLTVIAWIWARTVRSPNPAFANVAVPLASTFILSTKLGAYIEPIIENGGYKFTIKMGAPDAVEAVRNGTKLARGANFRCLMSGSAIEPDYIKAEGRAGRMGMRLMAIAAGGERGRIYLPPSQEHEAAAAEARPEWTPDTALAYDPRALWTPPYGLTTVGDLFTPRQLVALNAFADLVQEAVDIVRGDAADAGVADNDNALGDGGTGTRGYSEACKTFLALALNNLLDDLTTLATWRIGHGTGALAHAFGRQGIPMTWDFPEASPFSGAAGDLRNSADAVARFLEACPRHVASGTATQEDAAKQSLSIDKVVSTDPPYYDNIGYADLSDYFYVWLRRTLRSVFPNIFATVAVPKAEELVATPYRHGSKEAAERFFLSGMTLAMHRLSHDAHPGFPATIYYAFRQAETSVGGTSSTGWETFLGAVIQSGYSIHGTWPMRTERPTGLKTAVNALASSIILVCCPQAEVRAATTFRDFSSALKQDLPEAIAHLQRSNIAPVDLAQAAIGPGMAVFTRYAEVMGASGKALSIGDALKLINQTLDEVLAEQEGDFDSDTRWSLAWFEQFGFADGEYGVAEILSKAKNTSVAGLVQAGVLASKAGKVRLLRPKDLPFDWDPETDPRLTVWEMVHHLIRMLEAEGEGGAAKLAAKLGQKAEIARELAYRLYTLCERKKRAPEALSYNALVQSWPEIMRLAREEKPAAAAQSEMQLE